MGQILRFMYAAGKAWSVSTPTLVAMASTSGKWGQREKEGGARATAKSFQSFRKEGLNFEFDHTSVRLCQTCLRNLLPEWMIETGRTRRRGPFEF